MPTPKTPAQPAPTLPLSEVTLLLALNPEHVKTLVADGRIRPELVKLAANRIRRLCTREGIPIRVYEP